MHVVILIRMIHQQMNIRLKHLNFYFNAMSKLSACLHLLLVNL